jgi:hypothetical protein
MAGFRHRVWSSRMRDCTFHLLPMPYLPRCSATDFFKTLLYLKWNAWSKEETWGSFLDQFWAHAGPNLIISWAHVWAHGGLMFGTLMGPFGAYGGTHDEPTMAVEQILILIMCGW